MNRLILAGEAYRIHRFATVIILEFGLYLQIHVVLNCSSSNIGFPLQFAGGVDYFETVQIGSYTGNTWLSTLLYDGRVHAVFDDIKSRFFRR